MLCLTLNCLFFPLEYKTHNGQGCLFDGLNPDGWTSHKVSSLITQLIFPE